MEFKWFPPFSVLCLTLAAAALAISGCGGGDDSGSTATNEGNGAAVESEGAGGGEHSGGSGEPEPGDDHGGNAPAPSGDAVRSEKVEIDDFSYKPDPVTIEEGGKVIWKNEDSTAHTATAKDGSFDTGAIEPGKLEAETFKQPGTYEYVCSIHPQMHGTIEVVAAP